MGSCTTNRQWSSECLIGNKFSYKKCNLSSKLFSNITSSDSASLVKENCYYIKKKGTIQLVLNNGKFGPVYNCFYIPSNGKIISITESLSDSLISDLNIKNKRIVKRIRNAAKRSDLNRGYDAW